MRSQEWRKRAEERRRAGQGLEGFKGTGPFTDALKAELALVESRTAAEFAEWCDEHVWGTPKPGHEFVGIQALVSDHAPSPDRYGPMRAEHVGRWRAAWNFVCWIWERYVLRLPQ